MLLSQAICNAIKLSTCHRETVWLSCSSGHSVQGVISGAHGRKHMRKLSFASTLCSALSPSLSASAVPRLKGNNRPIVATAASALLWTWLQVANFMAQCFTCSTTPWLWPLPLLYFLCLHLLLSASFLHFGLCFFWRHLSQPLSQDGDRARKT